jgi:hypothetical protein
MKSLELMGVQEMDAVELKETDGGLVLLIVAAVVLVAASSCTINVTTGSGDINNETSASADSTNVAVGHGSGNEF